MQYSDLAVKYLQYAIERIQTDRITPVAASIEMAPFFIELAAKDLPYLNELAMFLLDLPSDALDAALLQQAVPLAHREAICTMRKKHEWLQECLEDESRNQRFEAAAGFRDQQTEVVRAISTILTGTQLRITPATVKRALQVLGWQHI